MRDIGFYRKLFGNQFTLQTIENKQDIVRVFDVDNINKYECEIIKYGGDLAVPIVELKENKRVAYYSDPDGYIFALLEDDM